LLAGIVEVQSRRPRFQVNVSQEDVRLSEPPSP
jgi:hypothetical protein